MAHFADQKGAIGGLQRGGGENVEDAGVGKAPVAPRQKTGVVGLETGASQHAIANRVAVEQKHPAVPQCRSFALAARQKCRSISSRRVQANSHGHGSTAISTRSIGQISIFGAPDDIGTLGDSSDAGHKRDFGAKIVGGASGRIDRAGAVAVTETKTGTREARVPVPFVRRKSGASSNHAS